MDDSATGDCASSAAGLDGESTRDSSSCVGTRTALSRVPAQDWQSPMVREVSAHGNHINTFVCNLHSRLPATRVLPQKHSCIFSHDNLQQMQKFDRKVVQKVAQFCQREFQAGAREPCEIDKLDDKISPNTQEKVGYTGDFQTKSCVPWYLFMLAGTWLA